MNCDNVVGNGGYTSGGSGGGINELSRTAGLFKYPATNPAPLNTDVGVNLPIKAHLMDSVTAERVLDTQEVPETISAGNIVFKVRGYCITNPVSETVKMKIGVSRGGNSETWDDAYFIGSAVVSVGSSHTHSQNDYVDILITIAIADIGLIGGDTANIFIERDPTGDTLTTDFCLTGYKWVLP